MPEGEREAFLRQSQMTGTEPAPVPRFRGFLSGVARGVARARAELAATAAQAVTTESVLRSATRGAKRDMDGFREAANEFMQSSLVGDLLEQYVLLAEMARNNPLVDRTALGRLEDLIRQFGGEGAKKLNFSALRSSRGNDWLKEYRKGSL